MEMKRFLRSALSMLFVCGLLLPIIASVAKAGNPAYSITEYPSVNTATVDGKWTSNDEWTDTPATALTGNATGKFGYNIQDFTNLGLEWIIEIFTDSTNDAGDYWQICFDDGNDGGTAPDTDDFKIEIIGHTTLKVYKGTGTGWQEITPEAGEIRWNNTISASPWNSTPHWILEVVDTSKTAGQVQIPSTPPTGMRIAAYDASTSTIAAWAPNSSANVPNTWGVVAGYSTEPIPEGFSVGVVVLLTCAAFAVSFYCLRKRPKTQTYSAIKL